jgi:glyoxylase-like metal-dependent hydrolase (beta-lactamase superfamily II)
MRMGENDFRFKLGEMNCVALKDGGEVRPVRNLLERVPAEEMAQGLVSEGFSATEWNQGLNCLLIEREKERILFDAGFGSIPGRPQGQLGASMEEAGISPNEVNVVVLTHGDPDHIGGLIDLEGKLKYLQARYFMSAEAWNWYQSEEALNGMQPEMAAVYRKIFPALAGRTELLENDREILPGIKAVLAPGHRVGHMVIEISAGNERLLHAADTFIHPIFAARPDWECSIDWHADQAAATRRKLFGWAAAQQALVFTAHLPFPGLGRIAPRGSAWTWQAVA